MTDFVFVLGAGRSGTKIFRDCLGAANDVTAIPYDVGYVWRYGNEDVPHDEFLPADANERIIKEIRLDMHGLGKRAGAGVIANTILEKSVPNVLRPAFVKHVFPEAKLINIVRNGRDVIESAARNWISPSDTGYFLDKLKYFPIKNYRYALWYLRNKLKNIGGTSRTSSWGPRYRGMQGDVGSLTTIEICAYQWLNCIEVCESQLLKFDASDYLEVRYEKFVSDSYNFESVCQFAGIKDVQSVQQFHKARVSRGNTSTGKSRLGEEDNAIITRIAGKKLKQLGYE